MCFVLCQKSATRDHENRSVATIASRLPRDHENRSVATIASRLQSRQTVAWPGGVRLRQRRFSAIGLSACRATPDTKTVFTAHEIHETVLYNLILVHIPRPLSSNGRILFREFSCRALGPLSCPADGAPRKGRRWCRDWRGIASSHVAATLPNVAARQRDVRRVRGRA